MKLGLVLCALVISACTVELKTPPPVVDVTVNCLIVNMPFGQGSYLECSDAGADDGGVD